MWNFVRVALGVGEAGEGVVHLPMARKELLRMIEAVVVQGARQLRAGGEIDGDSARERGEMKVRYEQGQGRSDNPSMSSLAPEVPEKPRYLSGESMAWRAWAWIERRGGYKAMGS